VSCLSGHLARAATGPGRDVSGRRAALLALLNLRRRSAATCAFGTEGRYRLDGPPPAQQSSHNLNNISVSVKPALRKLPRVTEAARELKSSAWPDVDEASEGRLPQQ
jgi:hypothetical protein